MYTQTNTYCQSTIQQDTATRVPGRKGTIARLIVLGIFTVIALLSSILTLPEYISRRGFGLAILEAFGGCGILLLTGALFWGFMKWISFMGPKSLGAANRFWHAWIPLTFFGLYIKACLWLLITVVPCTIYGLLMAPVYSITLHFTKTEIGFFAAMGLFILGVAATVIMFFVDICKLRQLDPIATAKEKLHTGK